MLVCIKNDNHSYLLKIPLDELDNIDITNKEEISEFLTKIKNKILPKNTKGTLYFDIYINEYYGMIIEVEKEDFSFFQNEIDIKIMFHLDSPILYKIDYFDIKKITKKNIDIYYYKNNTYLNIKHQLSLYQKQLLSELSTIVYNKEAYDIIINAIKLESK
ncbi:MAG: hypothetical protein Q4G04_06600 [bacterium]|nr:hypothetical protein [bacterium]